MINLAGSSFDFGNVLFAVLQECEHQRRAFLPAEAEGKLKEIAAKKLAEIRASYEEAGGLPSYWQLLEREVMVASLPQYVAHAIEQTRLEQSNYDLWRRGEPASRAVYALAGLVVGGLIWWAPFIPIQEKLLAPILAGIGFIYPELKRWVFELRHIRTMNRLVAHAEKYQKDRRLHAYSTQKELDEALGALSGGRTLQPPTPSASEPVVRPFESTEVSAPDRAKNRPHHHRKGHR
ncbi:MAG TPA: hypothetical protein VGS22_17420 [Thermoanaerobaculia bacterium]|jgi:hypothetical protein|nr:hypothetical protein [Thermoanaerobaculia bacterium]